MTRINTHLNIPKYPKLIPKSTERVRALLPFHAVGHSYYSSCPRPYKNGCWLLPPYSKNLKPSFLFPSELDTGYAAWHCEGTLKPGQGQPDSLVPSFLPCLLTLWTTPAATFAAFLEKRTNCEPLLASAILSMPRNWKQEATAKLWMSRGLNLRDDMGYCPQDLSKTLSFHQS